jgi:hypothetical protein
VRIWTWHRQHYEVLTAIANRYNRCVGEASLGMNEDCWHFWLHFAEPRVWSWAKDRALMQAH